MEHHNKIKQHINKRYNNFKSDTTKMIDSILKRHTDIVTFNNIKTPDSLITKPKEIKQKIQDHFET